MHSGSDESLMLRIPTLHFDSRHYGAERTLGYHAVRFCLQMTHQHPQPPLQAIQHRTQSLMVGDPRLQGSHLMPL